MTMKNDDSNVLRDGEKLSLTLTLADGRSVEDAELARRKAAFNAYVENVSNAWMNGK